MATTEAVLQAWLLSAVAAADGAHDELLVCDLLVRVASTSLAAKSAVMVGFYLLSLVAYLGTAGLLLRLRWRHRRRAAPQQQQQQQQQRQQQQQLGKPMAALVLGNLLHFLSILPLAIHGSGLATMDWIAFYAFYCNCAVVPWLSIGFNTSVRQQLGRMLTSRR